MEHSLEPHPVIEHCLQTHPTVGYICRPLLARSWPATLPNSDHNRSLPDCEAQAGSKGELKSPLMKVKEESEKAGIKPSIQKTKIMACEPITSWQIDGEKVEAVTDYFLGLQNHCGQ